MLLTGIDLETTSLNTATARIIEVGAVLWDWDTKQPLELCSTLVFDPDYPELEPEVEAVTGLNRNILARHGIPSAVAFHTVESIVNHSSYYVAHNGSSTIGKPWIDTTIDVPYPKHITTRKLTHLAAEHGFLNPFAHRAVFDVLTMLRVSKWVQE